MKNFKIITNIIIGSIVAYLSILFLAVAIDSIFLVILGLIIAPLSIIYLNKRFTVKPIKYYLSLVGAMVVTFLIFGMNINSNVDTVSQDNYKEAQIENKEESTIDKETDDEILANIPDSTTRALVGMIMAENRKLKRENSLLKEQTTFTIDMRESKNKNIEAKQDAVLVSYSTNLTQTELDALRDAISEDFMRTHGWTINNGRVKQNGFTIYKLGYIDAIKKILKEV